MANACYATVRARKLAKAWPPYTTATLTASKTVQ